MKENLFLKYVTVSFIIIFSVLFLLTFGKAAVLRTYIQMGVGSCKKIPVLCMAPKKAVIRHNPKQRYSQELVLYSSPKIKMRVPKGFTVLEEKIKKVFYKKNQRLDSGAVIYLLYEEPGYFPNLFPQLRNSGIKDNYEFISRTMNAKLTGINTLTDSFFVIMKGIFIPDVGDQRNLKMEKFQIAGKKVFINYTLEPQGNYFDCNCIDEEGAFFKVYIKDKQVELNLEDALTVISTLEKAE